MKPIRFSRHARLQMVLRGATSSEVEEVVATTAWEPARLGRYQARKAFAFNRPSPINQRVYRFKTVHVVFAEEARELVVVTVLVYYGNEEAAKR
ncbi:MAG: hypothetical protein ACPL7G_06470 [Chloroflexia bacterium]